MNYPVVVNFEPKDPYAKTYPAISKIFDGQYDAKVKRANARANAKKRARKAAVSAAKAKANRRENIASVVYDTGIIMLLLGTTLSVACAYLIYSII